ncbi:TrbG/VirB9 family P-type conjugative transfer protein [Hephaestia mangrovi]|uniref:TrbG/VirB9 family P-type conjugative transfer protein n=1 Tax=Hephaestia mangrovi TaxID=2873268 RepID=UPI001CA66262|nr:TrbG/VirB9 family P-type conjugative transfer protein [Hephaestia mangrovi]MBY8826572.1 TrbG/VirB9 family P-type conjugative transfer protein [Hephaestia mangrovi]
MTAIAALVAAPPLAAQVRPQPGPGDPHIQSVDYDPNQVVELETAPGYQLTVGLAADEQIESVAVGDSAAWQVSASHSGDHLFVKALQGNTATNMTVVTTTRLYAFDLVALSSPSPAMAYSVQFHYPSPATASPDKTAAEKPKEEGRYVLHGDHALRPIAMIDDGVHTYIQWPVDAPLPATYFRDDRGAETLANGEMRDGFYVIDSVHQELIFRIDKHDARAERVPSEGD